MCAYTEVNTVVKDINGGIIDVNDYALCIVKGKPSLRPTIVVGTIVAIQFSRNPTSTSPNELVIRSAIDGSIYGVVFTTEFFGYKISKTLHDELSTLFSLKFLL